MQHPISLFQNVPSPYNPKDIDLFDYLKNGLNQKFNADSRFFDEKKILPKYYNDFRQFNNIDLQTVLDYYRNEYSKTGKTDRLTELKKLFPAITPSGTFISRADSKLINHSGFIALDFDDIADTDIESVQSEIIKLGFVAYFGRSISNTGFYVICRIPRHENSYEHKKSYFALEKYFFETFGLKADQSCKDVARLRIYSTDRTAYINNSAEIFDTLLERSIFNPVPERKKVNIQNTNNPAKQGFIKWIFDKVTKEIGYAQKGQLHEVLMKMSKFMGGYVGSGEIDFESAKQHLLNEVSQKGWANVTADEKNITDGLNHGISQPLQIPESKFEQEQIKKKIESKSKPKNQPVKQTNEGLNVEKSVLWFILNKPNAILELNNFNPEIFFNEQNKAIAEAIHSITGEGGLVNIDTVHFKKNEIDRQYLQSIKESIEDNETLENYKKFLPEYYKELQEIAITNNLKNYANEILESNSKGTKLANETTKKLYDIASDTQSKDIEKIETVVERCFDELKIKQKQDSDITGVPSGLHALDKVTAGWQKSDLIILAGRPAMGKCLGVNTKVLMFDGTLKKVQDVKVGDLLMGDDSTPRKVLSLARGREQMYWIRQNKGIDYRVNESHILSLKMSSAHIGIPKNGKLDISVKKILKLPLELKNKLRGYKAKIDTKNTKINPKNRTTKIKIEKDIVDDYYGFTIDGNHRFLLEDCTVTHNTAISLSAMLNASIDYNIPVAFFSLEMSAEQLTTRSMSFVAEIESDKFKKGKFSDDELNDLVGKVKKLKDAPVFIDDTAGLDVFEFQSKCRKLKAQHDIQLIIVDYMQLMSAKVKGNREQEISFISRQLKLIAKELQVPVIALSQLSRAVETRGGDKRPMLSDLRESGSLEQDADMVLFLYRPEYYGLTEDEDGNSTQGIGEIIIAKHRNGDMGTVKVEFVGKYTKFQNLPEDQHQQTAQSEHDYVNSTSFQNVENNDFDIPIETDHTTLSENEVPF